MKLDLVTAYAANIARVASWAIVAGVVYRRGGAIELSLLMLARGTVGFLTYTSLGLAPALMRCFVPPLQVVPATPVQAVSPLEYARPGDAPRGNAIEGDDDPERRAIYGSATLIVLIIAVLSMAPVIVYAQNFGAAHRIPGLHGVRGGYVALLLAIGVLIRTWSDVPAAWLAATGRLAKDNYIVICGEIGFAIWSLLLVREPYPAAGAASAFAFAAVGIAGARFALAGVWTPGVPLSRVLTLVAPVIASGALVLLSQLADWLYAPFNQILISRTIGVTRVATYAPAIQIDGAMLLVVSGLSTVLLPKTAISHAHGDLATIRNYYVRGSLASLLALVACAVAVIVLKDVIFRLWFKDPMEATQAILPLVLIHTVIGGTASIGRSVLFGIGRIKAYTIAAVVGGIANVALAIVFVTQTNWGLRGIVLATIITVTVRCAIWMPWYTLRALRGNDQ